MSVATHLDLADPERGLLAQARHDWPTWQHDDEALRVVDDFLDLAPWVRTAPPTQADDVLYALAVRAATTGGDDEVAAGGLAWLLLPGAAAMAYRLQSLTPHIDTHVAAQLWIEIKQFPWERRHKVAANILMDSRRNLLRELEVGTHARRGGMSWSEVMLVDPHTLPYFTASDPVDDGAQAAANALDDVMSTALDRGLINESDRDLLLDLAVACAETGTRVGGRYAGLCARDVMAMVGERWQLSNPSIRGRVATSIDALSTYHRISA